jgi:phage host-nuclease inhibitor protein Gam
MENTKKQIDKMVTRLKELEQEIRELEKLADYAVAELKAEYSQQIKDLFLKKDVLQTKVSKVIEAGGNAWEDMKAGSELSWEVFEDSVKSNLKKKK